MKEGTRTMTNPLPLGIAAGVYKTTAEVPVKLLDTVASVTLGSFTNEYNHGNRDLADDQTELFDRDMVSINAKGLPNQGLPAFLKEELSTACRRCFRGKQARLRLSLAPRAPLVNWKKCAGCCKNLWSPR
ncbi:MAG: hypothetical protein R3B69_01540 [Candidatus Paceibacterota bacterium]